MKTLLNALLIATMTCSFAVAQRYDTAQLPTADHSSPKEPTVVVKPEPQQPSEPTEVDAPIREESWFQVYFAGSRGETLQLKMATELVGVPFLGLVIASTEDTMMSIPGLPLLLQTDILVASGLSEGVLRFDMGPAKLPFAVFVQSIAVTDIGIGASGVLKIEPAQ